VSFLENEPTFKEAIEELEKITDSLESGELELEQSLALFERGVALIKYCQDKLDGAQAKVEVLVDSLTGEIETAELVDEEASED
jgi:exodeoxyribonuclease VII small subunit